MFLDIDIIDLIADTIFSCLSSILLIRFTTTSARAISL